jgi:hypothetical protein
MVNVPGIPKKENQRDSLLQNAGHVGIVPIKIITTRAIRTALKKVYRDPTLRASVLISEELCSARSFA